MGYLIFTPCELSVDFLKDKTGIDSPNLIEVKM